MPVRGLIGYAAEEIGRAAAPTFWQLRPPKGTTMKMKLMIAALLLAPTLALRAEDKAVTPASVPATTTSSSPVLEDALTMQKKILRKLDDIEVRLDRIEAAQKTAAAADRKIDAMERDVRDIRRDTQRIK